MFLRAWAFIFFIILKNSISFSQENQQQQFGEYLLLLEDKMDYVIKTCSQENQFLPKRMFNFPEETGDNNYYSCDDYKNFLVQEIFKLQRDVDAYHRSINNLPLVCSNNIFNYNQTSTSDLYKIQSALKEKIQEACLDPKEDYLNCYRDQLCNLTSSVYSLFDPRNTVRGLFHENSCGYLKKGESDCLRNFAQGIWRNLVVLKDTAKSVGHFIFRGENRTANLLHLIRQFKHPIELMLKLAQNIFYIVNEAIKYHFSCDQWENDDFLNRGKCLKPALAWKCMDCSQSLNALCGGAGFILGQPLSSYIFASITGNISAGLDMVKIATPQVKQIFDAVKNSKGLVLAQQSTKYLKDKISPLTNAVAIIQTPAIIQKYQSAVNGAFDDGFTHSKHLTLKLGLKLGTQGYKDAFFTFKMLQHKQEVIDVGREYILTHYKNVPGIDTQKLADEYVKYITNVHDVPKFTDRAIKSELAKVYGKDITPQGKSAIAKLNQKEAKLKELYLQDNPIDDSTLKIIELVEKPADQVSRHLGARKMLTSGKNERFSDEMYRITTSPTLPFRGEVPSANFVEMASEMENIYLRLQFPQVYY